MAEDTIPDDPTWRERKRMELRERLQQGKPLGERLSHLDGLPFTEEEEAQINDAFHSIFKGAAGKNVMNYLARLTVDYIGGPGIQSEYLLHMEGSRYLYGIIKARSELGRKKR